MALQKQSMSVALSKGLDTKTDPKQVVAGRLLGLQNAVFTSLGRLRKRNGYAPFSRTVLPTPGLTSTTQVVTSGATLKPTLDTGWPKSTQTFKTTQTTLTVAAPSPSPVGGARLMYATVLWKTYRDPNTGLYTDVTDGTGIALGIADSNGVSWTRIAQANFQAPNDVAPGHHGCELWAAWYPSQMAAGAVVAVSFTGQGQTLNTLFTVYSVYNVTPPTSVGVASCFGAIATAHNAGGGTNGAETPINVPMTVPLAISDLSSSAVWAGQDGYDATTGGLPRSPTSNLTIDAQNNTNTSQSSGTLKGSYTGTITIGTVETGAWTNIVAAEILGAPQYIYTDVDHVGGPTFNENIAAGNSLFTYNNQLVLHDGHSLYTWGSADNAWYKLAARGGFGAAPAIRMAQTSIIKNSGFQAHPDLTLHPAGYTCSAYEDTINAGVRFTIIDNNTGSPLWFDQPLPSFTGSVSQATTYAPKTVSFGKWILLFYTSISIDPSNPGGSGYSLYCAALDTTNPTAGFATMQIVHGNFPSDPTRHLYDVSVVGTQLCIVFQSNTSNLIGLRTLSASLALSTQPWTFQATTFTGPAATCLTVFPDSRDGRIVIAWANGTDLKYTIYASNASTIVTAPTAIELAVKPVTVTGAAIPGPIPDLFFFYTIAPANLTQTSNYVVRGRQLRNGVFQAPAADVLRSVGLAGKAFAYGGTRYAPVSFESPTQPTNFVIDQAGNVVAKMLAGAGVGQLVGFTNGAQNTLLPEVSFLGDTAHIAMQERFAINSGVKRLAGGFTTSAGVTRVSITFGSQQARAVLASALHFGGGVLWMYDGASMVEHGFHVFPEGVTVPNPGGNFVYEYKVCYEWMDNQGNLHRSAPSAGVQQKQSAPLGPGTAACAVTIPTLRITAKQNSSIATSRRPVLCVVYRTIDAGTVLYRVNQTIASTGNNPTTDSITFIDTTTDAVLQSAPQIYTTGGVIENIAPNAPKYLAMVENRLWLVDSTNPLSLWFSKEVVPGSPVEFSDLLTFNLEPRGVGGAVALTRLDDKTVVFREEGVSYIINQGPSSTGSSNDFREVQLPAEVGCSDPNSIAVTSAGVLFRSKKGFFMLDRALNATYVGADVEAFNDQRVTGVAVPPKTNSALFTLSGGMALLYDFLVDQWSTFTNVVAVDSGIWNGVHVWLDADGRVHQETPGTFTDSGAYIPMSLTTSWLQLAGLQGFKRIWDILLLGDWYSPHQLVMTLSYGFDDRDEATHQVNTIDMPDAMTPLQWRISCAVEQCQSIQIKLLEQPITGTAPGEGLSLSAIGLEVGLKGGMWKLPASQSVG